MNPDIYTLLNGKFWIPKNDSHVGQWQLQEGRLDHDTWTQEQILPYIKDCKTILDGGSYNGDHTIFYSRIAGHGGTVIAVEAGAIAFAALEHNVKQFPSPNVTAINRALWHVDGQEMSHAAVPNLGASSVSAIGTQDVVKTIRIDTIAMLYNLKFDFLKLDIEGAEVHALRGANTVLHTHRPIMLIEVNTAKLAEFGHTPADILAIIIAHGYTFQSIQGLPIDAPQQDILCFPE